VKKIIPDFIMLPKVKSSKYFKEIKNITNVKKLIILVETISGLYNIEEITN
jgi:citrate lyase beta subunit